VACGEATFSVALAPRVWRLRVRSGTGVAPGVIPSPAVFRTLARNLLFALFAFTLSSRARPRSGRRGICFCRVCAWRIFLPRDGHTVGKLYYVYILAGRSRNLYTGVTNSLRRRVVQHRLGLKPGFTSKYKIFRLVYFEIFGDIRLAIAREKEIKAWRREKKVWLIDKHNPTWADLSDEWFGKTGLQPAKPTPSQSLKTAAKATADPSPPSKSRPGSG